MAISHYLPLSSPPLLSLSAAVVLVVRRHCPAVCQKSAPLHFTRCICRFPLQNLSALYPLQHLQIRILPLADRSRTCPILLQMLLPDVFDIEELVNSSF